MRNQHRAPRIVSLACCFTLFGCLSSSPPAPPVRWFDPTAAFAPAAAAARPDGVAVHAQVHLGQDVLVRTGAVELAYDTGHRWLLPVDEIVRRAFVLRGVAPRTSGDVVELTTFELDRSQPGAPVARVACRLRRPAVPTVTLEAQAAADQDTVEAQVAAMGRAVQQLVQQVLDAAR